MPSDLEADRPYRFEHLSWDSEPPNRQFVNRRTLLFGLSLVALAGLFCYDFFVLPADRPIVANWDVSQLDWLFVPALEALVLFGIVPLVQNPARTRAYWHELRKNRLAVASLAYLVLFVFLGTFGPAIVGHPTYALRHQYQPPLFVSVDYSALLECTGTVVGGLNGQCWGGLQYPLGTNGDGMDMIQLIVSGMRVSLQVGLVTAAIIVPVATTVGVVAGYYGGWIDRVLMGYVDVEQTVPAFVAYLMLLFHFRRSLFMIVLVFGLFNWGGVARLVRSEVLQRRESAFVLAAESAGASRWFVVRRHILPNVSNTVVTATTRQIPLLILIETAISFLNLNDIMLMSWGETIAKALSREYFPLNWWPSLFVVIVMMITVASFSIFGDALRDVLDPRGER